jgi:hypothetical protein
MYAMEQANRRSILSASQKSGQRREEQSGDVENPLTIWSVSVLILAGSNNEAESRPGSPRPGGLEGAKPWDKGEMSETL